MSNCKDGVCTKDNWYGCTVSVVSKVLVIVGGVNWGLVGLGILLGKSSSWNVVNMFLGSMPTLEAVVYVLVGVAALAMAVGCKCNECKSSCCEEGAMKSNSMNGSM